MKRLALAVIPVLALIFMVGCQPVDCPEKTCPACDICLEQEECQECEFCEQCVASQISSEKAILDIDMYTWAINELDYDEIIFDYWLMNFGDTEAKNVKVRCTLVDGNGVVAINTVDTYGNIASNSAQLGEILTKKTTKYNANTEYSGNCYVESCSNCDILYKRIPDLIEAYQP